ncbi:hypothetical protein RD792_014921 [Penstemon davidsonii]|uniref:Uncharacterized protein n=1 Tax=Penstemon davidsonii TaxID=160366 RepID=A0ABR0CSZ8_9LAMI|nr:hypothetical protein RD792_014921 [Penstemon davidsonii]
MAPRGFGPYGPRFPGDFAGPGPMMFPGRPSGGFGMMMGPGRAPFMGPGGPATARPRRPVGMPPYYPSQPSQNSNRAIRDQKAPTTDRNDNSDQGRGGKRKMMNIIVVEIATGMLKVKVKGKMKLQEDLDMGKERRRGVAWTQILMLYLMIKCSEELKLLHYLGV